MGTIDGVHSGALLRQREPPLIDLLFVVPTGRSSPCHVWYATLPLEDRVIRVVALDLWRRAGGEDEDEEEEDDSDPCISFLVYRNGGFHPVLLPHRPLQGRRWLQGQSRLVVTVGSVVWGRVVVARLLCQVASQCGADGEVPRFAGSTTWYVPVTAALSTVLGTAGGDGSVFAVQAVTCPPEHVDDAAIGPAPMPQPRLMVHKDPISPAAPVVSCASLMHTCWPRAMESDRLLRTKRDECGKFRMPSLFVVTAHETPPAPPVQPVPRCVIARVRAMCRHGRRFRPMGGGDEGAELDGWQRSGVMPDIESDTDSDSVDAGLHPVLCYPGRVGLANDTAISCYVNSVVQCLSHSPLFRAFFTRPRRLWWEAVNEKNPLSTRGALALATGDLVRLLWQVQYSAQSSEPLRMQVAKQRETFGELQQQDAQEFLAALLDGIHEEFNQVVRPPLAPRFEPVAGLTLDQVADECWARYLLRNRSFIVRHCMSQLKSTLQCRECGYTAVTFDPYMYLSLPLPDPEPKELFTWLFVPVGFPSERPLLIQRFTSTLVPLTDLTPFTCTAAGRSIPDSLLAWSILQYNTPTESVVMRPECVWYPGEGAGAIRVQALQNEIRSAFPRMTGLHSFAVQYEIAAEPVARSPRRRGRQSAVVTLRRDEHLGLRYDPTNLRIVGALANSPADVAGLSQYKGWAIRKIAGRRVRTVTEVRRALTSPEARLAVEMELVQAVGTPAPSMSPAARRRPSPRPALPDRGRSDASDEDAAAAAAAAGEEEEAEEEEAEESDSTCRIQLLLAARRPARQPTPDEDDDDVAWRALAPPPGVEMPEQPKMGPLWLPVVVLHYISSSDSEDSVSYNGAMPSLYWAKADELSSAWLYRTIGKATSQTDGSLLATHPFQLDGSSVLESAMRDRWMCDLCKDGACQGCSLSEPVSRLQAGAARCEARTIVFLEYVRAAVRRAAGDAAAAVDDGAPLERACSAGGAVLPITWESFTRAWVEAGSGELADLGRSEVVGERTPRSVASAAAAAWARARSARPDASEADAAAALSAVFGGDRLSHRELQRLSAYGWSQGWVSLAERNGVCCAAPEHQRMVQRQAAVLQSALRAPGSRTPQERDAVVDRARAIARRCWAARSYAHLGDYGCAAPARDETVVVKCYWNVSERTKHTAARIANAVPRNLLHVIAQKTTPAGGDAHRGITSPVYVDAVGIHRKLFAAVAAGNEGHVGMAEVAERRVYSLTECLELFTGAEELETDERWVCRRCERAVPTRKIMELWGLPNTLLIHVKRFAWHDDVSLRLRHKVAFPIAGLDLGSFLAQRSAEPATSPTYKLQGVVAHQGVDIAFGHYTSFCPSDSGMWLHFDDTTVTEVTEGVMMEQVSANAYLLVYSREDMSGPDEWLAASAWPDLSATRDRCEAEVLESERQDRVRKESVAAAVAGAVAAAASAVDTGCEPPAKRLRVDAAVPEPPAADAKKRPREGE